MMVAATTILLVDDHCVVRGTLLEYLQKEPDLHVVGSVSNADDAVTEAVRAGPDVVLMDIDMPGLNAFDAAQTIRIRCRQTSIVFLSAFVHDRYIEQALRVEAAGYIAKSESPERVLAAIRTVARDGCYFSPEVRARLIVDIQGTRLADATYSRASTLSPREIEVLRYIAMGMSQKQMAETMSISQRTVNAHCSSLMQKLDIHDRVKLARFAIREGFARP